MRRILFSDLLHCSLHGMRIRALPLELVDRSCPRLHPRSYSILNVIDRSCRWQSCGLHVFFAKPFEMNDGQSFEEVPFISGVLSKLE